MTVVAVTGAAGSIGQAVTTRLSAHGYTLRLVDRRAPSGSHGPAVGNVTWHTGSLLDRGVALAALAGSDVLVHLAAHSSPKGLSAEDVYLENVTMTAHVLGVAAELGIRHAVIASSISILGLVYGPAGLSPKYIPVDEAHPLTLRDGYALAKHADESFAELLAATGELNTVALRFPFTTDAESIRRRMSVVAQDPTEAARELWAYLDLRDCARAIELCVDALIAGRLPGYQCINVIAEDTLLSIPIADAMHSLHPTTALRPEMSQRRTTYDTSKAVKMLRFVGRSVRVID